MKVNGEEFDNEAALYGPIPIKRGEKMFLFYAQPVWSYDEFHATCSAPKPPVSAFGKKGKKQYDFKNPLYLEKLEKYASQQLGWMILTSLAPTNLDLTEQGTPEKPIRVALDDPETWHRVEQSLTYDKETNPKGLSHFEFKKVMEIIDEANLLDNEKMEANLESFLLDQARQEERAQNSPDGEPKNTSSGELVNDGE